MSVPAGYEGIIPYICVENAAEAITFYERAFDAKEEYRIANQGQIGHAEMTIADARFMLSDPWPESGAVDPKALGGTPATLHLYVEDVDAVVARAVAAGAELTRKIADQFYGDRSGMVTDPYGHRWSFATRIEDLSPEELRRRATELFGE